MAEPIWEIYQRRGGAIKQGGAIRTSLRLALVVGLVLILKLPAPKHFNNSEVKPPKAVGTQQAPAPAKPQVSETAKVETKAEDTPVSQPEPVAAEQPQPVETPVAATTPEPGSHEEMMAAAGIPTSDWAAVDYIVSHESTWNTTAVNRSSGSCGLVQELPCGKSGCRFGDGVCQLRWATNYADTRYGSWWGAHSFWSSNHWW